MISKKFPPIKVVLCMAALTMVMASPAFALPTVDGKISDGEYFNSFSVTFEVDGGKGVPNIPVADTGKLWYYQDSNNDLYMAFIQPKTLVDNSYGANSIGWGTAAPSGFCVTLPAP